MPKFVGCYRGVGEVKGEEGTTIETIGKMQGVY
jgi:hypothetical protein